MNNYEKVAKVWSRLVEAAKTKSLVPYSEIDSSNPQMVGKWYLKPIEAYCLREKLPALTVLVVNKRTGMPGLGFEGVARKDIPREQGKCPKFR